MLSCCCRRDLVDGQLTLTYNDIINYALERDMEGESYPHTLEITPQQWLDLQSTIPDYTPIHSPITPIQTGELGQLFGVRLILAPTPYRYPYACTYCGSLHKTRLDNCRNCGASSWSTK